MALPMTKSPVALAKTAYSIVKQSIPQYSCAKSPKKYTQHQLFAILVLRQFLKTDYRGIVQMLHDFSDLRNVLDIEKVPHYSTLYYAEKSMLKKNFLKTHLAQFSNMQESAA